MRYGIIVLRPKVSASSRFRCKTHTRTTLDGSKWDVLLVKTPRGNVGFPKGGSELKETPLDTAQRETYEETGFSPRDLEMIDGLEYFEYDKGKRNRRIGYLVAICRSAKPPVWPEDELQSAEWCLIHTALKHSSLSKQRKSILTSLLSDLLPFL